MSSTETETPKLFDSDQHFDPPEGFQLTLEDLPQAADLGQIVSLNNFNIEPVIEI